jgi:hypothetical protein
MSRNTVKGLHDSLQEFFSCLHFSPLRAPTKKKKAGDVVGKADGTERVFDNKGVLFARAGISIKVVRKN